MRSLVFLLVGWLAFSCSEKELLPISPSSGKPGQVTNVVIKPRPGGALVTFQTPNNKDLLGVKAVYKLSNGKEMSSMVSYFDNHLLIEGFNDEQVHTAQLYAINRAQEMSDPIDIQFQPLKSDVKLVSESFEIQPDFGGPRFKWLNENKAPITIEMYVPDSLGNLTLSKVMATSALEMFHVIRGFDAHPIPVAALVKDRFGNVSDTIRPSTGTLTPLFETKIPKGPMRMHMLMNAGDVSYNFHDGADQYMIDDNYESFGHSNNGSMPGGLTIDMGTQVKMSRFTLTNRDVWGHAFSWGNVKDFEVYGRSELPNPNGGWDEWDLILDEAVIKPSGIAGTDVTPEDVALGLQFDFIIPIETPPFRYFRFRVKSTWSEVTFAHICEFDFYGQIVN